MALIEERQVGADPMEPEKGDPMRTLRGQTIASMVRMMVDGAMSNDRKPKEAFDREPDSVLSLEGRAYSSLTHTIDTVGNVSILPGGKSDSSISFEMHDTTLSHLLGVSLEPAVIARRGKTGMADALTELAAIRWQMTGMENTCERLVSDARLRGTCGAKTFRDPAIGLARTTWIPTRNLIIDPSSDGDLERTKFRGEKTYVFRSELRRMLEAWGKDPLIGDTAARGFEFEQEHADPLHFMRREAERIEIIDFYWCDGNFRRHIILVNGVDEPVWDVDRWPYELPNGRWPINVFQWNAMPNTPWGRSDFGLVQLWEESLSWMQRFLLDSTAEAAKVIPVFDRSVGDPDTLQKVLGDLRRSYEPCPMNLSQIAMGGMELRKLMDFLAVPTQADKIQAATEFAREVISRSLGLDEMSGRLEQPGLNPPRLARRMARWRKFLSLLLEAESCVDLTVVPKRALVSIKKPGNDPVSGVPIEMLEGYAYMALDRAEALEKNAVAHATRRGLTAEQWDPAAHYEHELRLNEGIDDESMIVIKEPGIYRYVSRKQLAEYWEGAIPGVPTRVNVEYTFHVEIVGSLESSDQMASRSAAALQQLTQLYATWGVQGASFMWAETYSKAMAENKKLEEAGQKPKPLPAAPKMLTNILMLHQDFVRSVGAKDGRALTLRPEDLATALAMEKQLQDQQAQAQAAAAQPPPEDPRKLELEVQKLQIEVARLELQKQKAEAEVQSEQLQAQTEQLRQQHEVKKQQVEEERLRLEHEREMAELPFRLQQTAARTEATIAQKDKALVAAQTEVLRAQQQETAAELEAALTSAEAQLTMMKAEQVRIQSEISAAEHNARLEVPADTQEAKDIASAQELQSRIKEAEARIDKIRSEVERNRATAEREKAQAGLLKRTPPAPPKSKASKKK